MSQPENLSALHILSFVYLTFSHVTDGELAQSEVDAIANALQGWLPEAPPGVIRRVIVESAAWVNSLPDDAARLKQAEDYAHLMKTQMNDKQRGAVLVNLIEVARADGRITTQEEQFITRLTDILGMS